MPVTFPISIATPDENVKAEIECLLRAARHPAGDFRGLLALVQRNLEVAAAMWGGCFSSSVQVEIEVVFKQAGEKDRAGGASKGAADLGKSKHYADKTLIMEGAASQIAGVGKPSATGISIDLPANEYLTTKVWFDPDPVGRSQRVPPGLVDGVTLFLHEMAHALGFNGRLVFDRGDAQWGQPKGEEVSRYDEWVRIEGRNFFFHGPSAMAANDGLKVPLSDNVDPNNDYTHLGNDAGRCAACRSDLMTGFPWEVGRRYAISPLDLAILEDVGLPVL
jgi:hypothetical protein